MRIVIRLLPWVFCASVKALPYWLRDDGQAQQPVPVTGMATGFGGRTGERPIRWEINAFQEKGGPIWDLYLQGLAALQNKTEADERSHFSVAGIHGRPHVPYNGVGPVPGSPDSGFCPHGETQFVAWHRPYLALYEQVLGTEIQRIASEYGGTNASVYQDAARLFRLPYWDWSVHPALPPACVPEHVVVIGLRGPVTIRNPLYSYKWQTQPMNETLFPGSKDWPPETTRASDKDHPDFSPNAVDANLETVAGQLKLLVYRTFTHAATYDQMATTSNPAGVSFEMPHNIIHNSVGGSFVPLDTTAFDSLFMLHHANIDRLAALWTAIHANDATPYMTEPYTTQGLYATAAGDNITAGSPLKPFYQADGQSFHTGYTASNIPDFGYTYAELGDWEQARNDGEREKARRGIVGRVNALYGSNGHDYNSTAQGEEEWFVQIAVDRSDLALPCNIDVLVEIQQQQQQQQFVGRMSLPAMPMHGRAYAEIPLERGVISQVLDGLNATTTDAVGKALSQRLRVEIKGGPGGTSTDAKKVASLELILAAAPIIAQGSEFEFPKYGKRNTSIKILPTS